MTNKRFGIISLVLVVFSITLLLIGQQFLYAAMDITDFIVDQSKTSDNDKQLLSWYSFGFYSFTFVSFSILVGVFLWFLKRHRHKGNKISN